METRIPRHILEKAVKLKDPLRQIFMALYTAGKPSTASEIAELTDLSRAYASARLNQLVAMGLVKRSRKGKTVMFEVANWSREDRVGK